MNQKLAIYLAFAFLFLVGIYNIINVLSNLRNRKARKAGLWLRILAGLIVLCIALAFGYQFIWMKMK